MVSMVAPVIPQVSPVPFLAATMGAPIASIGHTGHVPHASSGRIFFGNVPFATWMENDLSYYEVLSFELFWNGLASSKSLAKVFLKYWSAKQHGNWKASLFTYHVRICPYCFWIFLLLTCWFFRGDRHFPRCGAQDVTDAQLEQLFRSIGPITDLHLMRTADGKSRGMGHVTYQIHVWHFCWEETTFFLVFWAKADDYQVDAPGEYVS